MMKSCRQFLIRKTLNNLIRKNYLCGVAKTDVDLQKEYKGLLPRFKSVLGLFSDDEKINQLADLESKKVVSSGMVQLFTYADLQNPLLKKYNFDPVEFMEGATHAFLTVHKAIGSLDLTNYVNGYSTRSEMEEMLRLTLSPQIYKAILDASETLKKEKIEYKCIDFKIHNKCILTISTDIIEDVADNTNKIDNEENNEDQTKFKDKESNDASDADPIISPSAIEYPVGSVIATATVFFKGDEVMEYTLPFLKNNIKNHHQSDTNQASETIQQSRLVSFKWTFRSCISSHAEYDWRIVAFDGMGDLALYKSPS